VKHPVRAALAAAALLLLGSLGAGLSPAVADHYDSSTFGQANKYGGHWYYTSAPGVGTSNLSWASIIQDAAYFWQDNGAPHSGYTPAPTMPAGGANCGSTPRSGWIDVCPVLWNDANLDYGAKRGKSVIWAYPSNQHIDAVKVYINSGLTGSERQNVMRHEFGHAIGLGHQGGDGPNGNCDPPPTGGVPSYSSSVMRCDAPTPYINSHDRDGILTWNYWHNYH
jgi:hypothetical protein